MTGDVALITDAITLVVCAASTTVDLTSESAVCSSAITGSFKRGLFSGG
jgi:hypothetical protein